MSGVFTLKDKLALEAALGPDNSREGVFRDHNCYRCKDGSLRCIKGKGHERECENLHARND